MALWGSRVRFSSAPPDQRFFIMSTNTLGKYAESLALHELTKRGFNVSIPFGEYRYDLIAEKNGFFKRIQIKYVGSLTKRSTISVILHSISRRGRLKYNADEIDYVAVYCKPTENFYIIPYSDVSGKTAVSLRVKPSANNQSRNVIPASSYENRWDFLENSE